jgi:manganese/iron transport system permease protein
VAAGLGWIGLSASYEASLHHDLRLAAGATVVVAYTIGFAAVGAARFFIGRLSRKPVAP